MWYHVARFTQRVPEVLRTPAFSASTRSLYQTTPHSHLSFSPSTSPTPTPTLPPPVTLSCALTPALTSNFRQTKLKPPEVCHVIVSVTRTGNVVWKKIGKLRTTRVWSGVVVILQWLEINNDNDNDKNNQPAAVA